MKKLVLALSCLIPVFLFTGCQENGLLLNLNPDGSGTVVIRAFQNSAAMQGMMGVAGGGAGGIELKPDPEADARQAVESVAEHLGEVTRVSGKTVKNKQGWIGHQAVYRFSDVNQVTIPMDEEGGGTPGYTIKFTPGSPAKLELTAVWDKSADAEAAAKTDAEFEAEFNEQSKQLPMMMPMLEGMRSSIMVKLNGRVVDSNAAITSAAGKHVFVLADMEMAKAVSNPKVVAVMKKYKGTIPKETIIAPGMKLQDVSQPVVVTFQ